MATQGPYFQKYLIDFRDFDLLPGSKAQKCTHPHARLSKKFHEAKATAPMLYLGKN
jgi:hypothetical protein